MDKYVEMLRRYFHWHHEEAKRELREARNMIRAHLGHHDCNEWNFITVDKNYIGSHPITSTLDFDPNKNKNAPEGESRHKRHLSKMALKDIIHGIVVKDGLYYFPHKPTIKTLHNGYGLGM